MNGFGFVEYKDPMDARDVVPGKSSGASRALDAATCRHCSEMTSANARVPLQLFVRSRRRRIPRHPHRAL